MSVERIERYTRSRIISNMGAKELWDEPWEGLPEDEAAWEWDPVSDEENGATKNPPDAQLGWKRWYFIYHQPSCTNIKISADRDPRSGKWFNPHRSSGTSQPMIRAKHSSLYTTVERQTLRRRVKQMHAWFNQGRWEKCFSLIDPILREKGRVELPVYSEGLQAFQKVYGAIHPWYVRISLHLDASSNKRDPRPFAYVYVVWQDDAHRFHMFQERWVRDEDQWFTRVVGLAPNQQEAIGGQD